MYKIPLNENVLTNISVVEINTNSEKQNTISTWFINYYSSIVIMYQTRFLMIILQFSQSINIYKIIK